MDIFRHSRDHIMPWGVRISLVEKSELITHGSCWRYARLTSFQTEQESPGSPDRQSGSLLSAARGARSAFWVGLRRVPAGGASRSLGRRAVEMEHSPCSPRCSRPRRGEGCQQHARRVEACLHAAFSTINLSAELGFLVLTASPGN